MAIAQMDVIALVLEEGIQIQVYKRKCNSDPGKINLSLFEHTEETYDWYIQLTGGQRPEVYQLVLDKNMKYLRTHNPPDLAVDAQAYAVYVNLRGFILAHAKQL